MAEGFTVEVARNASHIDGSLLKRPWLIHLLDLEWNRTKDMSANDFFSDFRCRQQVWNKKMFSFLFLCFFPKEIYYTHMEEPADDEGSSISFSPVRAPVTLCRSTA
jgi:hypothetical protein